MSVSAETVFVSARSLLNDDGNALFTDTVLFPKLTIAHRELQAILRANDTQVMRATATGSVTANTTTLVTPPTDLQEPIKLWEKVAGSPVTSYQEMDDADPIDPALATGTTALNYWQWKDEVLTFRAAASNNVDVLILYWRLITIPVLNTDLIGIAYGELYLAPRIAALEAGSLGDEETYNVCTDIALKSIQQVIAANKGRMNVPVRP